MVNYVRHVSWHNYKERSVQCFCSIRVLRRYDLYHVAVAVDRQWDVKYLNNGFIMRSSARRSPPGDANDNDVLCGIMGEKVKEKSNNERGWYVWKIIISLILYVFLTVVLLMC